MPSFKVSGDLNCWIWTGRTTPDGTPQIRLRDRTTTARRHYWEREHGPVPEGMQLAALCRNRLCVRPRHQQPMTRLEIQRLYGLTVLDQRLAGRALLLRKTHGLRETARRLGVDPETIRAIERGTHWTVRGKESNGDGSREAA